MLGILLTLHILIFVMAFAFTAGVGILSARVARSRDTRIIHGVFVAARPLQWAGGIGWFVAGALGVWIAADVGLPFDSHWLLWSYVAFAALVVAGLGMHAPWQAKVIAASAYSTDGIVTPELDRLLRSSVHPIASALSAVSFVALVYLMTAQPG